VLEVIDLLGRQVAVVVEGRPGPGVHTARFEAGALAAGVYLVRLRAGGEQVTRWLTVAH
jgi:hypothetical protein